MAQCEGNLLQTSVCSVGNGIGDVAAGVVKSTVLSPMAKELMDSFDSFMKDFMTSWLGPGLTVNLDGVSVNWFKDSISVFTVALMVVGLMIAGIRVMMDNRSLPLREAAKSFFQVMFVVTSSTILINALILGFDAYSKWILAESGTGVDQFGLQTTALLGNPGLAFVVGIVGLFAVLIQWCIMLGRNATLPLLVAFWPTAAAANLVASKAGMFEKIGTWILAFLIYKPMAASIYALAWKMKSGEDGVAGVLNGVVLIVLAILTLPALLRLMTPVTAALGNASGGSMAVGATVALVTAGVAMGAAVATGGASAAASGGGAATQAAGKAATTSSTSASAGAGPATGGPAVSGGGPSPSSSPASSGGGTATGSDPATTPSGDTASVGSPTSSSPGTSPASGSSPSGPSGASPSTESTPGASPANGSESPALGGGAAGGGGAAPAGGAPAGAAPVSGSRTPGTGTRAATRIAEAGAQAARGINDQVTRDGRE